MTSDLFAIQIISTLFIPIPIHILSKLLLHSPLTYQSDSIPTILFEIVFSCDGYGMTSHNQTQSTFKTETIQITSKLRT